MFCICSDVDMMYHQEQHTPLPVTLPVHRLWYNRAACGNVTSEVPGWLIQRGNNLRAMSGTLEWRMQIC